MAAIAIVGLGPWGLCVLERVISRTRTRGLHGDLTVHVIEPRTPGAGVYELKQPDYLLLNNPAGQLSLCAECDGSEPYAVGLYDWAVARGYRWVGERCLVGPRGRPLAPEDYLPRRIMGEYLHWFYGALVRAAPDRVRVTHHAATAVDIVAAPGRELVVLDNGATIGVAHVILTSGHTANREGRGCSSLPPQLAPYRVSAYTAGDLALRSVAVSGMGLVGIDVVIALTIGRGGSFRGEGDELSYRPSGREPKIRMFSRSGIPYPAKTIDGIDRTHLYRPAICTEHELARLRERSLRMEGVDFRTTLLPLLLAEMSVRYYAQLAFTQASRADAAAVRGTLARAWQQRRFEAALADLQGRFGGFDAREVFFGPERGYADHGDYEHAVLDMLAADLREARVPGGASPYKCASEVWRIFRDPIRSVVEHRGLTLDSYLDFHANIRSRINRMIAGPPALRSAQLLALADAGLLSFPYGPAPAFGPAQDARQGQGSWTRTRISSTQLRNRSSEEVDAVIRGHLDEPRIDGSASALLNRLYERERISQLRYGSTAVGSVDLTPDGHPLALDGTPQERIWMFGVLTEGARHFNHYVPSPRSRIRAVHDIGRCVAEIFDSLGSRRAAAGRGASSS